MGCGNPNPWTYDLSVTEYDKVLLLLFCFCGFFFVCMFACQLFKQNFRESHLPSLQARCPLGSFLFVMVYYSSNTPRMGKLHMVPLKIRLKLAALLTPGLQDGVAHAAEGEEACRG